MEREVVNEKLASGLIKLSRKQHLRTTRRGPDAPIKMMIAVRQLADAVKLYRHQRDWSQKELARRSGITASTVSNLESGSVEARWYTVCMLADALGISLHELRMGPGTPLGLGKPKVLLGEGKTARQGDYLMVACKHPGEAVRVLRAARGWGQHQLARAAGIGQQTISFIEGSHTNGHVHNEPFWGTACLLADALGVTVDDLRFGPLRPYHQRRPKK